MILLAGFFAISISLEAQNPNRTLRQREMPTPEQRADRLVKELELNDAQKAKLVEYYKKQDENFAKRRAEMQKTRKKKQETAQAEREKFNAEMAKLRKAQDAELEKIIGKDKMEQHKKNQAERAKKFKERREKQKDRKSNKSKK